MNIHNNTYQCIICFEEKPEEDVIKHCNDKHIFCKHCFESYVQTFLNEESVVTCPLCRSELPFIKNGLINTYYDTESMSSLHTRIFYNNDIMDGLYETYYPSANVQQVGGEESEKPSLLASRYYMKNNKIDGLRVEYYDNGQLWLKCHYKDGLKDGVFEEYYETENSDEMILWRKGFYGNGKRSGLYQTFDINGNIIESINYD